MSKKIQTKTILLYIVTALLAVACGSVFDGALSFGIFVGALYCANPFISAIIYLVSSIVYGWGSLIQAGVRTAVMLLFVLIHKFAKKRITKLLLLLYLVLSNVFYCAYHTADYFMLFDKLLYSAFAIAFSYICIYTFRALFVRGLVYRPALDETVCISLFAVAVSYGLSSVTVFGMNVVFFAIPFALLFCSVVFGDSVTLVCAALVGLGNLLATGTYECCAFCVFASVAILVSSRLNRFVSALSVLLIDVIMSYFFNLHGTFSTPVFVPTLCSAVVFVVIPGKVYTYLKDCVCGNADRYLGKSVVKKLGLYTAKKLYRLSEIFLSMKNAFFTMSMGAISAEDANKGIVRQCAETVCKNCAERNRCWRVEIAETEQNLLQLAECASKKGKCTILDVPQNLSLKCARVSTLLAELNTQIAAYREYTDRVEQVNSGKLLLSEQLGGVSNLLNQLAADCKGKITYDSDKEQELVERLVFHNVLCCGAVIMEQSGSVTAIVTVAQKDYNAETVEQIASNLLGQNMTVDKTENVDNDSWVNVFLSVKPRFTVSFGVSAAVKNGSEISGDTHSAVRTDNGKCIIALCDGMGSGTQAEQMSATAIGLVENFYRAGFDSDTILSCVNRLLTGCGNEVFCAVDICVIDLSNGLADFIKLGAPVGFVKCADSVEIVSGSSLPLGVLEEMKPSITKKAFQAGDMLVLVSDGLTDCFNDPNYIAKIFSDTACTNPQSVAEEILNKALRTCNNKPQDDMTVVAVKIA